jgi:hypothetical protein
MKVPPFKVQEGAPPKLEAGITPPRLPFIAKL